jgi:hypothetical protein
MEIGREYKYTSGVIQPTVLQPQTAYTIGTHDLNKYNIPIS